MYIYHFWPLSMHCQKTTTIRCFLEATYVLLVVLRKPWICTLCFDHILANFVIFDDFGPFLIENGHFGPLLRTSNSHLSKSHDISAFKPWTLSGPAQNPYFNHFGTPFEGPGGRLRLGPVQAAFGLEDLLRASQNHARDPKFWSFWPLLTSFWVQNRVLRGSMGLKADISWLLERRLS